MRSGLAGTCPTFIVDDRWVVKFFGRLFDGAHAWMLERACALLLADAPDIPTPALLASGRLFDPPCIWSWPYLVFAFVPGVSIGEARAQLDAVEHRRVARDLGVMVRRIHAQSLPADFALVKTWDAYRRFLQEQRARCTQAHAAWGDLPVHLLGQIDDFLLREDDLIDASAAPHLIHADLTADHLLGEVADGRWITHALIDFGDAMVGGLEYELVALHLGMFRADKRLLAAFLDGYGLDPEQRVALPRRAMTATLLHQFNVLGESLEQHPELGQSATLDELATRLWDEAIAD